MRCGRLTSLSGEPQCHSRFIFNITVAPANCFTHFCIVTQSPCYGDYGNMRVCAKFCVNQHHSNTEKIHVCELVWRHDFYSVYAVKVRRHTPWSRVRCHGCRFTHSQFHSQFHSRRHSLRITLKYTTLVHTRSGYAWTMKSWQRSEGRLGFNSVLMTGIPLEWLFSNEELSAKS